MCIVNIVVGLFFYLHFEIKKQQLFMFPPKVEKQRKYFGVQRMIYTYLFSKLNNRIFFKKLPGNW